MTGWRPPSTSVDGLKYRLRDLERDVMDLQRIRGGGGSERVGGSEVVGGGYAATVTVAASDAADSTKAACDYVCDGTDDEAEIYAAFAECDALGGGRVLLSEGSFTISIAGCGDVPADTILQGQGIGATQLLHVGASANSVFIGSTFAGEGAQILDMTLDATGITSGGYGLNLGGARTRVERVRMVGLGFRNNANIEFTGHHCTARACEFIEPTTGAEGVSSSGDYLVVEDCFFNVIPGAAVHASTGSDFAMVTGNRMEWTQSGNTGTDAIVVQANSVVVGNICRDNRGSPATITSGPGSLVANNVLL